MAVPGFVVFARCADRQTFFLGDAAEMLFHRFQHFFIDQRFITKRAQIAHDIENRRLRRAVGKRRHRRMHDANALFDDFQQIKRRETVVAMRVEFHRHVAGVVENQTRQGTSALRREHPADIFVAKPIGFQAAASRALRA